jgi:septum formation protein
MIDTLPSQTHLIRSGIVLASQSEIRKTMLRNAGVEFDTISPDFDEEHAKSTMRDLSSSAMAGRLAAGKALSVSKKQPIQLIIGADQVLELDGRVMSKPRSPDEAQRQLRLLRGKWHRLHSAAACVRNGRVVWRKTSTARLSVRRVSDAFIKDYVHHMGDDVVTSVGGYKIEGRGLQLFDAIAGDYHVVLGLPLLPLLAYLREEGFLPR